VAAARPHGASRRERVGLVTSPNAFTALDHAHMARALVLAERGAYTTKPNPMVGCVLADGERVLGEGWHQRAGEAHAEVLALKAAGDAARGGTAYVTLEPCGRHGRTPPCVDALVAAGVARVVVAAADPFQADAEGLRRLRAAGIVVESGLMAPAARELNRGFFARIERGRPWLRIKLGASIDGRTALADGRSQWITGPDARADVMHWRARSSALLTGSGTVRADNPRLTVRWPESLPAPAQAPPLRVVLDPGLAVPADSHLLDGSVATMVLHAPDARVSDHFGRVETLSVPERGGRLDLDVVLKALAQRGCNEVQVEAGATLAGAFVAAGLCDELLLYLAPRLLGPQARPLLGLPAPAGLDAADAWRWHDVRQVGADLRVLLRPAPRPATG
jgi:diaminohydroxyphosphoribosylaminopyrimidine deaminase/5-amino-6-(5-phosphoribosylamino)uracil reductase